MSGIKRIEKRKVSGEIVAEIKRLISDGVFQPEEKLPSETELSNQFGVSRASVREALSMLAAAEILETRQGQGTFVRHVQVGNYIHPLALSIVTEEKQTLQLLEMRQVVEAGTVEFAAIRRNENDIKDIKQSVLDIEAQLESGESEMEADFNFHMAVAAASKNPLLIKSIENIAQVMRESLQFTYREKKQERRWEVLQEHKDILDCIQNKDPEGAILAMKWHLKSVQFHLED